LDQHELAVDVIDRAEQQHTAHKWSTSIFESEYRTHKSNCSVANQLDQFNSAETFRARKVTKTKKEKTQKAKNESSTRPRKRSEFLL
jgi:hypothetical protein